VYLDARKEQGEDRKVDNAIRAYVDPQFPRDRLTSAEKALLDAICSIKELGKYGTNEPAVQQASAPVDTPSTTGTTLAGTAAAIAADAAANTVVPDADAPQTTGQTGAPSSVPAPQPTSEPQRFTPNMTAASPAPPTTGPVHPVSSLPPSHRPSVEPLTPVPGSPAIQNGTPLRRPFAEVSAAAGAEEMKAENNGEANQEVVKEHVKDDDAPTKTE
jgi:hypothetical protein